MSAEYAIVGAVSAFVESYVALHQPRAFQASSSNTFGPVLLSRSFFCPERAAPERLASGPFPGDRKTSLVATRQFGYARRNSPSFRI
jgi:hypothetical protein